MGKKIILSLLGMLLLVIVAGGAYAYYLFTNTPPPSMTSTMPLSAPDNSVVAGPVTAISATSITVQKQDGTTATLSITANTSVVMASTNGQPGTPKKLSDVSVGTMVLVTPASDDESVAQTIIII